MSQEDKEKLLFYADYVRIECDMFLPENILTLFRKFEKFQNRRVYFKVESMFVDKILNEETSGGMIWKQIETYNGLTQTIDHLLFQQLSNKTQSLKITYSDNEVSPTLWLFGDELNGNDVLEELHLLKFKRLKNYEQNVFTSLGVVKVLVVENDEGYTSVFKFENECLEKLQHVKTNDQELFL